MGNCEHECCCFESLLQNTHPRLSLTILTSLSWLSTLSYTSSHRTWGGAVSMGAGVLVAFTKSHSHPPMTVLDNTHLTKLVEHLVVRLEPPHVGDGEEGGGRLRLAAEVLERAVGELLRALTTDVRRRHAAVGRAGKQH